MRRLATPYSTVVCPGASDGHAPQSYIHLLYYWTKEGDQAISTPSGSRGGDVQCAKSKGNPCLLGRRSIQWCNQWREIGHTIDAGVHSSSKLYVWDASATLTWAPGQGLEKSAEH